MTEHSKIYNFLVTLYPNAEVKYVNHKLDCTEYRLTKNSIELNFLKWDIGFVIYPKKILHMSYWNGKEYKYMQDLFTIHMTVYVVDKTDSYRHQAQYHQIIFDGTAEDCIGKITKKIADWQRFVNKSRELERPVLRQLFPDKTQDEIEKLLDETTWPAEDN